MPQDTHWGLSLYTFKGARKYVNTIERERFFRVIDQDDPYTRTFCMTLAYTGCRISEALALTARDIHADAGVISFRTLKQRKQIAVIREVPVPPVVIRALQETHNVSALEGLDRPLWLFGRTTAWKRVKKAMTDAGIAGPHASPKGLRHGFGVHAILRGIPLHLVQRWLGHSSLATTAIYTNVVGPEEYVIAKRMW